MRYTPYETAYAVQMSPEKRIDSVFHRPQRRPRVEPSLSLDRIVSATVALLDREGAAALTMRRVAAELGVHATSLYWYVERREDLIDLAVDEVLAAAGDLVGPEEPWDYAVTRTARQFYDALTTHPWAAQFAGSRTLVGPNALALSRRIIAALRDAGGTDEDQAIAVTAISNQILGAATTAVAIRALGLESPSKRTDDIAAAVGAPEALAVWRPYFDEVLALLVDGIRTRLTSARTEGPSSSHDTTPTDLEL